jgi:hypothetical protein
MLQAFGRSFPESVCSNLPDLDYSPRQEGVFSSLVAQICVRVIIPLRSQKLIQLLFTSALNAPLIDLRTLFLISIAPDEQKA